MFETQNASVLIVSDISERKDSHTCLVVNYGTNWKPHLQIIRFPQGIFKLKIKDETNVSVDIFSLIEFCDCKEAEVFGN